MHKIILKAWDKHQEDVRRWVSIIDISTITYELLLENTLKILFKSEDDNGYGLPDFKKITAIDDGDYQGTILFLIPAKVYQPSENNYWYTAVDYGSCSGCDTLQGICNFSNGLPNEKQIEALWTLCLHMMQKMKKLVDK